MSKYFLTLNFLTDINDKYTACITLDNFQILPLTNLYNIILYTYNIQNDSYEVAVYSHLK